MVTSICGPCIEGHRGDLWHEHRGTRGRRQAHGWLAVILMLLDILAKGLGLNFIFRAYMVSMTSSNLLVSLSPLSGHSYTYTSD